MKTNINLKFNNIYELKLIDSITGKVKQEGTFHNIVLNTMKNVMIVTNGAYASENTNYTGWATAFDALCVGKGTTEPKVTDTALASQLWRMGFTSVAGTWVDDYTYRKTGVVTIPADTSHVGVVTEVGLAARSKVSNGNREEGIVTRALLTDSEGQIISFNKTDLDILIITVTIEATFVSNNVFTLHKKPAYLSNLFTGINTFNEKNGYVNLCRYYDTVRRPYIAHKDKEFGNVTIYKMNYENELYIRYDTKRLLATEVTDETYYKAISIPGIGYWELPNEDIFPTYTITGINIGIGDGVTTSFENPLSYFKKDTDKIYKNGVLLTRGIDYTINHLSNINCLPEVVEFLPLEKVHSDLDIITYLGENSKPVYPLLVPGCNSLDVKKYDMSIAAASFSANYPLYAEYSEEVTLNCFKCTGGLQSFSAVGDSFDLPNNTLIYLDYSINGEDYIEIGSTTISNRVFTMDFPDVTAKYWRIRTSYATRPTALTINGTLTLFRKDPYIVFAEAPAEGDIITMDVDMDIIMKNSNFVVDIGAKINFTI